MAGGVDRDEPPRAERRTGAGGERRERRSMPAPWPNARPVAVAATEPLTGIDQLDARPPPGEGPQREDRLEARHPGARDHDAGRIAGLGHGQIVTSCRRLGIRAAHRPACGVSRTCREPQYDAPWLS